LKRLRQRWIGESKKRQEITYENKMICGQYQPDKTNSTRIYSFNQYFFFLFT